MTVRQLLVPQVDPRNQFGVPRVMADRILRGMPRAREVEAVANPEVVAHPEVTANPGDPPPNLGL